MPDDSGESMVLRFGDRLIDGKGGVGFSLEELDEEDRGLGLVRVTIHRPNAVAWAVLSEEEASQLQDALAEIITRARG